MKRQKDNISTATLAGEDLSQALTFWVFADGQKCDGTKTLQTSRQEISSVQNQYANDTCQSYY